MTRTNDVLVSLSGRIAFARSHQASLFVSVHANTSSNRQAHGASVWVRSSIQEDEQVTHLAANSGNAVGIANALAGPGQSSTLLQYTMIDSLNDDIRMDPKPARHAHFFVLGMKHTPSVLLEIGFLSNRHDEKLLKDENYRRAVAQAIQNAIDVYFTKVRHPGRLQT